MWIIVLLVSLLEHLPNLEFKFVCANTLLPLEKMKHEYKHKVEIYNSTLSELKKSDQDARTLAEVDKYTMMRDLCRRVVSDLEKLEKETK